MTIGPQADVHVHDAAFAPHGNLDKEPKRTFMIALDRSPNAHYAFLWAKEHFNLTSDDCVVLVTVCEPISPPAPYGHPRKKKVYLRLLILKGMMYIDMTPIVNELHEEQRQIAHGLLRMHGHILQQEKIPVQAVILHGDPGTELCRKAEELNVDGLILGSRGMGTVKR